MFVFRTHFFLDIALLALQHAHADGSPDPSARYRAGAPKEKATVSLLSQHEPALKCKHENLLCKESTFRASNLTRHTVCTRQVQGIYCNCMCERCSRVGVYVRDTVTVYASGVHVLAYSSPPDGIPCMLLGSRLTEPTFPLSDGECMH